MAYIKTEVANYGTRVTFLEALRDFFVNNSVAQFEVVSDVTEENQTLTLEHNKLAITLSTHTTYTGTYPYLDITVASKIDSDTYSAETKYSQNVVHSANDSGVEQGRAVQIFLVKSEDSILLQIGSYNATTPSKGVTILDCGLTNGLNLIGSGRYNTSLTIPLKESQNQSTYTIRPYHTGTNDDTKLILSNSLAVNNSAGVYSADVVGLKSAGGAKQFSCYVTDTDSYYAVLDDVVITLGEKLDYVRGVNQ